MKIKVNNIKTHTLWGGSGGNVSYTKPVIEAKLVLLRPEDRDYMGKSPLKGFICIPGTQNYWFKPVLISETEYCVGGQDKYLDNQNTICNLPYASTLATTETGKKILALPEHFSKEQLNMIVEGKLKDGDKVYVECIHKGDYDEYLGHGNKGAIIKRPLSIYPIEEKLYTIEQLEQSFDAGFSQGMDVATNGLHAVRPDFKEWIKTLNN